MEQKVSSSSDYLAPQQAESSRSSAGTTKPSTSSNIKSEAELFAELACSSSMAAQGAAAAAAMRYRNLLTSPQYDPAMFFARR